MKEHKGKRRLERGEETIANDETTQARVTKAFFISSGLSGQCTNMMACLYCLHQASSLTNDMLVLVPTCTMQLGLDASPHCLTCDRYPHSQHYQTIFMHGRYILENINAIY